MHFLCTILRYDNNNNNNINNGRISVVLLKEGKINGVRTRDRHVLRKSEMYFVCLVDSDAIRKQDPRLHIQLVQQ